MEECVDGEYQAFKAKGGAYLRKEFFGKYPELLELVSDMTDDQLADLHRGGHDPAKIYNAYKRAVEHKGGPTVILAKTVKGYGLGTTQARNAAHQEKKLTDDARHGVRGEVRYSDSARAGKGRASPGVLRPTAPEIRVHAGAPGGAGWIYAEA